MPVQAVLSLVWFFYFAGVGIFFPYFSLYLRENAGLSGTEVGLVLSVWPLVGMLAQPLWGQLADRSGARRGILVVLMLGTAAGMLCLPAASGLFSLTVVSGLTAVFSSSAIPMLFAVSMGSLGSRAAEAFGFVRVWGTVSYLLLVVGFPWLLARHEASVALDAAAVGPTHPGLGLMFPVIATFSVLAACGSLALPAGKALSVRAHARDWRRLVRHPPVRRLLLFHFLAYVCVQGPMALFPVWVASRGGDIEMVGRMWLVMLVLEIPLVAYSGAATRWLGAARLLQLGILAAGLRWFLCGAVDDLRLLYAVQVLHAIVVAGTMIGGPVYLESIVPEQLRSTGQSLLSTVSTGLGGILSNLATGWMMDHFGIDTAFVIGGGGAMLLALVGYRLLAKGERLELTRHEGSTPP